MRTGDKRRGRYYQGADGQRSRVMCFAGTMADAATVEMVEIARGMQPLPEKVLEAKKEKGE